MKFDSMLFVGATTLVVVLHNAVVHGFVTPTTTTTANRFPSKLFQARNTEFSVLDDNGNVSDNAEQLEAKDEPLATTMVNVELSQEKEEGDDEFQYWQYAALSPSTTTSTPPMYLQIQVGDLSLARKAWKKRRRSGSPLLAPCSVLSLDRTSMIRENLIYLLYLHGSAQKDGIVVSLQDLKRTHLYSLKSDLEEHALALGYEDARDMVQALFKSKGMQNVYQVRIVLEDDELFLKSPISKYRAVQKASKTTLLQVTATTTTTTGEETGDQTSTTSSNARGGVDIMKHTGHIRCKSDDTTTTNGKHKFSYPPLSAALRVSQRDDLDTGNIQQGSILPAVFFDFDAQGDGGSPLLILSLNPGRKPTGKKTRASSSSTNLKYAPIRNPRHMISDLQVGDGPYEARVVRLAGDHALVDFGVGRSFGDNNNPQQEEHQHGRGLPDFVRVYGMLRFKDAVDSGVHSMVEESEDRKGNDSTKGQYKAATQEEEDMFASMNDLLKQVTGDDEDDVEDDLDDEEEESEEDVTQLFSINDDGSLSYSDPETGETEIISTLDEDSEEEEVDDEEDEDRPVTFTFPTNHQRKRRTTRLRVGDRVPVHILSVSKQSSQFRVTTDPAAVRGKNAKDIKKEGDVTKKLERLSQLLGGLHIAEELRGREFDGTVKATSRTGDWLYVEPNRGSGGDGIELPVGVATVPESMSLANGGLPFAQGDLVRIKLNGIDESRGQLGFEVISKLSP